MVWALLTPLRLVVLAVLVGDGWVLGTGVVSTSSLFTSFGSGFLDLVRKDMVGPIGAILCARVFGEGDEGEQSRVEKMSNVRASHLSEGN